MLFPLLAVTGLLMVAGLAALVVGLVRHTQSGTKPADGVRTPTPPHYGHVYGEVDNQTHGIDPPVA